MDERKVATRDTAARIAGISRRQVDYWAERGLVVPSVVDRLSPRRPVVFYSFLDLLALTVAAELRRRNVSLQHIREIVERVRTYGHEEPLTQLRWATEGSHLFFQHPDGEWESGRRPGQALIQEMLDLDEVRGHIRRELGRSSETVGRIEKRRGAMGSKKLVAGTRVPVETVRRYIEAGRSPEQIVESFPVLELADVRAVAELSA